MRCYLLSFLIAGLCDAASNDSWPSFRGPNGSGVATAAEPPLRWSNADNVRWKTAVPGVSHSSPIVMGGRVYLLTAVAGQGNPAIDLTASDKVVMAQDVVPHRWRMLAFDLKSGKLVWDKVIHEGTPRVARHAKGSYANATPATDGKVIVAMLGNEAVVAVDRNGRPLWKHDTGLKDPKAMLDPASSPVIFEDLAIVQSDWRQGGYLAAFDLKSGREAWRVAREDGMCWSTPALRGSELVVNSGRWIRGYDARTGRERWKLDNSDKDGWDRIPVPLVTPELTVIAGGGAKGRLIGIRPGGAGDITAQPAWSLTRGAPYQVSPLVYEGLLYVLQDNGVLRVHRVASGDVVYEHRLAPSRFSASPVAAAGRVYFTSEDGEVFVVRAGDRYELLAKNAMEELVMATPAITGRTLLVRTAKQLYAIGR